jgi:hypothetical protein
MVGIQTFSVFPTSFESIPPWLKIIAILFNWRKGKICFSASYLNRLLLLQFLNFFRSRSHTHTRKGKKGKKLRIMKIFLPKLAENLTAEWIHKEPSEREKKERQMYLNIIPNLIVYLLFIWNSSTGFFPFQTVFFSCFKASLFSRNDYVAGFS